MEYSNWNLSELYVDEEVAKNKYLELNNIKYSMHEKLYLRNEVEYCKLKDKIVLELNKLILYFTLLKNNNKKNNNYDILLNSIYDLYGEVTNHNDLEYFLEEDDDINDFLIDKKREIINKYVFLRQQDLCDCDNLIKQETSRYGNRIERKKQQDLLEEKLYKNRYEYYNILMMFISNCNLNNRVNHFNNIFSMNQEYYDAYRVIKSNEGKFIKKYNEILNAKKQVLEVEELRSYDLKYELLGNRYNIDYNNAKILIEYAVSILGLEYKNKIKEAFEKNWINATNKEEKEDASLCYYVHGFHPYITVKYNNSLDSLLELIHELGHALKYEYGNDSENKIFKEVPAVLNEIILYKYIELLVDDKYQIRLHKKEIMCKQVIDTLYDMEFYEKVYNIDYSKVNIQMIEDITKQLNEKYYGDVVSDLNTKSCFINNHVYKNYEESIMYLVANMYAVYIEKDIISNKENYIKYLKDDINIYELVECKDDNVLNNNIIEYFIESM